MLMKRQLQVVTALFAIAGLVEGARIVMHLQNFVVLHDGPALVVAGGLLAAAIALVAKQRLAARGALLLVLAAALFAVCEALLSAREQGELHAATILRLLVGPMLRPTLVSILGFGWLGTKGVVAALDPPPQPARSASTI
jgi:type IV secretory pathway TrbD component